MNQVNDLPFHGVTHPCHDSGIRCPEAQQIDASANRCERISKFVRQCCEKLRLAPVGFGQAA
jgi:hypothetical protein